VALLVVGFAGGWHAKGVSVAAGQAKVAQAEVQQISDSVAKQATALQQQLQAEQGKSVALAIAQQQLRTVGDGIRLEIADAHFTPTPVADGVCPAADPVGSDEFVRLYNRAAKGGGAAATGAASTR
jgi:TolA-binding protein